MYRITIPLIALLSMNANAISNNVESCILKNQDLIKDKEIENSEDINDKGLEEIENILAKCQDLNFSEIDNEEILEYLRHTGWTWQ